MSYSLIRKYAIQRNEAPALSRESDFAHMQVGSQLESAKADIFLLGTSK